MKVVIVACPWAEILLKEGARRGVMESMTTHFTLGPSVAEPAFPEEM